MGNTQNNVPPLNEPLGTVFEDNTKRKKLGEVFINRGAWSQFFQQFVQNPPQPIQMDIGASPSSFMPNANGLLVISGGTLTAISLVRGTTIISVGNAARVIPVRKTDSVIVTYAVVPTAVYFLPD